MSNATSSDEAVVAAKHALGRVRALRAREIPYHPLEEMESLRAALAGEGSALTLVTAAELEVSCTRVELAWTELDMRRASIVYLGLAVRRRGGPLPASIATAEEFLRTWNEPFADVLTVEGRVWMARRLEGRMTEDSGGTPAIQEPADASPSIPTPNPEALEAPDRANVRPVDAEPAAPPAGLLPRLPWKEWIRTRSGLTFLVIGAFLLLGAYDRLHSLGADSLWNDEAQSTLLAISVLRHGYPVITSQHLINNFEPLYPYFEALSVIVLGQTNVAYRLPSAVFGILLIPVSYYVGSRLRDRYVGIAFAAMVAFSSELIGWSRQARWYMLLVLIMALALLAATLWARSYDKRRRFRLVLGLAFLTILAGFTSVGLFLLYVPAILGAALVYLVVEHWTEVRRFFGVPEDPDEPRMPARFVPYWLRQLLALMIPSAVAIVALAAPDAIGGLTSKLLAHALGFAPYPLVWSTQFSGYLTGYYLGVLVLDAIGTVYILWRHDPLELSLLTFCLLAFIGVSSLASLTNNIAAGNTAFERHIVPLLFFLFLVAAIGLIGLFRSGLALLSHLRLGRRLPAFASSRPFVCGILVAAVILLPGIVAPANLPLHAPLSGSSSQGLVESPMGVWSNFTSPFALEFVDPSSIYQADQSNYQAASAFVTAHRNATDVVGATNPGPPQVYLGTVGYWIRANPDTNTIVLADGKLTFFQTGSVLVNTSGELESLMENHSGWLISDVPSGKGPTFSGGMSFVLSWMMSKAFNATTVAVFSWNRTTPVWELHSLAVHDSALQRYLSNSTALYDWAATIGVTTSNLSGVLLPLEAFLVAHTSADTRAYAVLLEVYEAQRNNLTQFQNVTGQWEDNAPLIAWAASVASGATSNPAAALLQPYESWYANHDGS
jgi:hypothetical protein